jgi:hypothetical protein
MLTSSLAGDDRVRQLLVVDTAPRLPVACDLHEHNRREAQLAAALQACVRVAAAAEPGGAFTRQLVVEGKALMALRACVRDYVAFLRDAGTPPELAIAKLKSILNQNIPQIGDHSSLDAALVTAGIQVYDEAPPAPDGR